MGIFMGINYIYINSIYIYMCVYVIYIYIMLEIYTEISHLYRINVYLLDIQ